MAIDILTRALNARSRRLDKVIEERLSRLQFAAVFRRTTDQQAKDQMMDIMLLANRNQRQGIAKMKAFLAESQEYGVPQKVCQEDR
jgi:hypothetical protein